MNNPRLFFVPLLAEAFMALDRSDAFRKAFDGIRRMGQEPEYAEGYAQFQAFMRTAQKSADAGSTLAQVLEAQIAAATAERTFDEEQVYGTRLLLERDGKAVAEADLDVRRGRAAFPNLREGRYTLRLDSGRVIWRGELTPQDVLWIHARPSEPLPLAADSREAVPVRPLRDFTALGGAVRLRVYPGLESGTLTVDIEEGCHDWR